VAETQRKIKSFIDLDAWKEAHKLVLMIYEATGNFPRTEIFGLTAQIRRAVVSVTSNVAEGFSRRTFKEKVRFYSMALGSLTETQSQLIIARDVKYLEENEFNKIVDQTIKVAKIMNGLIKSSKFQIPDSKF